MRGQAAFPRLAVRPFPRARRAAGVLDHHIKAVRLDAALAVIARRLLALGRRGVGAPGLIVEMLAQIHHGTA